MLRKFVWLIVFCFAILTVFYFFGRVSPPSRSIKNLSKTDAIAICDAIVSYYKETGSIPPLDNNLSSVFSGKNPKGIVFVEGVAQDSNGNYLDHSGHPLHFRIINNQVVAFDVNKKQIASRPINEATNDNKK